jgi:hypothetical protein
MSVAQQNGVSPGPRLPYEDEGVSIRRVRLSHVDVDVAPARCVGKIVERSVTTWWVQIQDARKRVGWTNEPSAFDGRNALGG